MKRPSWDEYFMQVAELVSTRSTCLRRHVGAVIVKDKCILSTGYNGASKGAKHCDEVGCIREKLNIPSGQQLDLCRAVHAEQNALIQAAKHGISTDGASIYITVTPCYQCAKMIANSGIKEVIVNGVYPDDRTQELFKEVGIELRIL